MLLCDFMINNLIKYSIAEVMDFLYESVFGKEL